MTKKGLSKRKSMHKNAFSKCVNELFLWLLVVSQVIFSFFYLTPWTDDNVTKIHGVVSNISAEVHWKRASFVTFSIGEHGYYYHIAGGLNREDVQRALQKATDDGIEVTISVTSKPILSSIYFLDKNRVVAIEGEGINLSVTFQNRHQQIRQIVTLICAVLLILLKYWPHIAYFLVVRSVEKGKGNKKPIRLPRQKNKNQ